MNSRDKIIVFTRYPEPGKTKTRLIPLLGPEKAASFHKYSTELVISVVRTFAQDLFVTKEVCYTGGNPNLMVRWLGEDFVYALQTDGDIGVKMSRAFRQSLEADMNRIVLIGTDCPALSADILRAAFHGLLRNDVVLGPATDGGYYLIGLRRAADELFTDIEWGSSAVLAHTLQRAEKTGLSVGLVATLNDVDTPEDFLKHGGVCADRLANFEK